MKAWLRHLWHLHLHPQWIRGARVVDVHTCRRCRAMWDDLEMWERDDLVTESAGGARQGPEARL
jgi:hypothetical protein